MINKYIIRFFYLLVLLVSLNSCKKFLNAKSDQSLSTPQTLDDIQAILRDPSLNQGMRLTNGGSDEFYIPYNNWLTRTELQKAGYVWDPSLNDFDDWNRQYITVFYANTALFNLDKISSSGQKEKWNICKGTALFFRAHAFYQIAQLYAPQYDSSNASVNLGIPLRLNADFNETSVRSSVQQTYERIIKDAKDALVLLSPDVPATKESKARPSRVAAYALLARVYLQIGDYIKAKENADACLQLYDTLLDFNELTSPTSPNPIDPFASEMIFYTTITSSLNSNSASRIDSNLYNSFDNNDLRKVVYFRVNTDGTTYRFKGSYNSGSTDLFNGLATDEVFLIRAEASARLNDLTSAMKYLNALLSKRWKKISFVPATATTTDQALRVILAERKKELIYRGLRWSDLKRLNNDPRFLTTIQRNLNGQIYSLLPNDLRYSLLIPIEVISTTSIQQNRR